jgi:RNA polymerase sigma factor for flagellar operon FliA
VAVGIFVAICAAIGNIEQSRQQPPSDGVPEGAAMRVHPIPASQNCRIVASLPFVEALARRMAATMPNSIDVGDLVQDGVLGLIDAAHRFDEGRGIKFETFAERRVRGAMIDALRRDAWPRGVRRQRRELEAAREELRRELGHEPSIADLAAKVGSDEKRLGRTIVRINTIESTSPLATGERFDESSLPAVLVPSEPDSPDSAYEKVETRERVLAAIQSLPQREGRVIGLYYYGDVTMKQIGAEIGVNESRVSQLHARAIRRLRDALGQLGLQQVFEMRRALAKPRMLKAELLPRAGRPAPRGVVVPYTAKRPAPSRAILRMVRPRRGSGGAPHGAPPVVDYIYSTR